jgi:hypothetical protein
VKTGDDAAELRAQLTDPHRLCAALGLLDGYKSGRQAGGGVIIRCPAHQEHTPSCSVRRGRDGTVAVSCFGCGFTGDALTLIAAAHGLDIRADFPAVLGEAARLAGVTLETAPRASTSRPAPSAAPEYPAASEVAALWAAAGPVEADHQAAAYLAGRAIDPGTVDLYDLARVLGADAAAPSWARCRGRSWTSTHRLILPVVDYRGAVRSLRAWRCSPQAPDDDTPKRTAPAGKALAGLVLACPVARQMLATGQAPSWASKGRPLEVVIAEGEPDFLTWASRVSDADETPPAILGVVAGSWCDAIAARIPDGSRVIVRTHQDTSGERYAAEVRESLAGRAVTLLRARGGAGHGAAA